MQNRQSDSGFYVDPENNLDLFPVSGSTAGWTNNVYHHVVLTEDGTNVNVYLDGVSQFTAPSGEMDLNFDPTDNPSQLLGVFWIIWWRAGRGMVGGKCFAVSVVGWRADGRRGAQTLANNPFANIPEPASVGMLGLGSVLLLRRRRGFKA